MGDAGPSHPSQGLPKTRRRRSRQERSFDSFSKSFLRSLPSKTAVSSLDYSIGDESRVNRYLRKAFARRPPPPPPPPPLPSHLLTLIDCQEEDGRWEPKPQVMDVLGGPDLVPRPPKALGSEMVGWRWTTALVVAFLRQEGGPYLQVHEPLQECYLLAIGLVSDHVLQMARAALPPRHCYYHLEPELVHEGQWNVSADRHMQREGYLAFVNNEMRSRARHELGASDASSSVITTITVPSSTEEAVDYSLLLGKGTQTKAEVAKEMRMKVEVKERHRAARKREEWRQQMLQAEYQMLTKQGRGRMARRRSMVVEVPDLTLLQGKWEEPIEDAKEFKRLQAVFQMSTKKKPRPWAGQIAAREFVATKSTPLAQLWARPPPSRPASTTSSSSSSAAAAPVKIRRRSSLGGRRSSLSRKLEGLLAQQQQQQPGKASSMWSDARGGAQGQVVAAILAMESYLKELRAVLHRCLNAYKTCRVYRERMAVLDELTAWLGHYRAPQPGYDDWRGKGCLGLHTVICEVVEAVVRWREVVEQEAQAEDQRRAQKMANNDPLFQVDRYLKTRAKARAARPPPFLWNGSINILLYLPYIAEFLSGFAELRSYYGTHFEWRRNPFCRPVCLDERAPTPRATKRKVMIGDQMVETEVPSLVALHQEEQARLDAMNAKIAKGGFWWVGYGAGEAHAQRLRRCEKVLLEEERIYGKQLSLSFFRNRRGGSEGGGGGEPQP